MSITPSDWIFRLSEKIEKLTNTGSYIVRNKKDMSLSYMIFEDENEFECEIKLSRMLKNNQNVDETNYDITKSLSANINQEAINIVKEISSLNERYEIKQSKKLNKEIKEYERLKKKFEQ